MKNVILDINEEGIVITEELNQKLIAIAKNKGISVTELVNQYLEEGFEKS